VVLGFPGLANGLGGHPDAHGDPALWEAAPRLGLQFPFLAKPREEGPAPPVTDQELDRPLSCVSPWALTATGFGGIAAILWMMKFKPI
jgi:hypothetical protein